MNEHGTALNVFWSRQSGMGVDGKCEPAANPRTRWVTERIASESGDQITPEEMIGSNALSKNL